MSFQFDIQAQSTVQKRAKQVSRARRGTIHTPHGDIQTPAFVTVGTKASVKALTPQDLEVTGTQFVFANTYHLVLSPTPEIVEAHGGIHKMSGINKPFITDSGGFQAFSLAFPDRKNMYDLGEAQGLQSPGLVKISDAGVEFKSHIDGRRYFFTPESSIEAQQKIGADFMVAFDECIYNGASEAYTTQATNRTHEWAKRSVKQAAKTSKTQQLYGVIQGGRFQKLRQQSTKFIAELPVFGIALGGVSVGEKNEELREEVTWISEVLQDDPRPRHLLGISTFDDVLFAVQKGVDTFDCILPTRDGRTGRLYVQTGIDSNTGIPVYDKINILNAKWRTDVSPINSETLGSVTYAYLHHLFKQRELLAYRLGTIHNLIMIERYFAAIREAIENGRV